MHPNGSFNFYVQVHVSDVIKGVCRWQLIEFIISLNQFCFNNSLQIFAASSLAKTVAFVPLSRLERATSANADLDTRGPTVNLVMPHLTLFYLYITFMLPFTIVMAARMVVCLYAHKAVISGFCYNRWVGYKPST